jgi:hypothetical protein
MPLEPAVFYITSVVGSKLERGTVLYRLQWKPKGGEIETKNRDWATRENFREGGRGGAWVVGFGDEGLTEAEVLEQMDLKDTERVGATQPGTRGRKCTRKKQRT